MTIGFRTTRHDLREFLHSSVHIFREATNETANVFRRVELFILDQRSEIDAEVDQLRRVDGMALVVRGMGATASHGGKVIAFAAYDLRIENSDERSGDVFVLIELEHNFVCVHEPIEIAPYLATIDFLPLAGGNSLIASIVRNVTPM